MSLRTAIRHPGSTDTRATARLAAGSRAWRPPWWHGWLALPFGLVALVALADLPLGRQPGWPEAGLLLLAGALSVLGAVSLRTQALAPALCGPRPGAAPRVALTFDDGPDPATTPLVLAALGRHRATFFVIGEKARAHPELIHAIRDAGHQVASHGERHCWRAMVGPARARRQILDGRRTLRQLGIDDGGFFRPPYGLMIPPLAAALRQTGSLAVGWSLRSLDTVRRGDPRVFAAALAARVRNGDIVLLHDAPERPGGRRPLGIEAAATLVAALESRGFEFVTVAALHAG